MSDVVVVSKKNSLSPICRVRRVPSSLFSLFSLFSPFSANGMRNSFLHDGENFVFGLKRKVNLDSHRNGRIMGASIDERQVSFYNHGNFWHWRFQFLLRLTFTELIKSEMAGCLAK